MAITRTETQVLWTGSSPTDSVAAAGSEESLEVNLDATCVAAQISLKANNGGTPASGDTIDFYILQTSGEPDVDPSVTDDFDTPGHAQFLARLDTNIAGENPAITTVALPIPQKGFKIRAVSGAASNAITVSATITEQRAA